MQRSLTIQQNEPADTANWLPAPDGPICLVIRLYGPTDDVLNGTWTPPRVARAG